MSTSPLTHQQLSHSPKSNKPFYSNHEKYSASSSTNTALGTASISTAAAPTLSSMKSMTLFLRDDPSAQTAIKVASGRL